MASGRDFLSVHRSLQRFLSTILAEPWDVQPTRREPQTRPLCVVRPLPTVGTRGTAYVREFTRPIEVMAYPLGVDGDPWAAELAAGAVFQTLIRAFDSGFGSGVTRGYAMRVPLFDYSGVAAGAAIPDDQAPLDYLVVQNLDGSVQQDPEQDDLFTILIDFQVNWRDDGDVSRFDGATLGYIPIGFRP